jgi:hypothetical protein
MRRTADPPPTLNAPVHPSFTLFTLYETSGAVFGSFLPSRLKSPLGRPSGRPYFFVAQSLGAAHFFG